MEQRPGLGNQQERLDEADLAWLAGIVDGEGCISLNVAVRWDTVILQPRISVTNTNQQLIEEVARIARLAGLAYHISNRQAVREKRLPISVLESVGQKRVRKWVDVLLPRLRGKTKEIRLLNGFITSREMRGWSPLNDFEKDAYVQIRLLHAGNRLESSETLRQTLERRLLERRESPSSRRKRERVAEMTTPAV